MSFRLRCHLAFLPLFLGFSIAAALLAYLIEWRQVRWGLDEQSQGNALCLAAFLTPTDPGQSIPDLPIRALAANRFSRGMGGLTSASFEPRGREWRTRLLASTSGLLMPPVPEARVVSRIRNGGSATLVRTRFGAAYDEVIGYAGLYDATGGVRAIVGVTAKDAVSRAERRRLWRAIIWLGAGGLIGGVMAAEVLTQWVRHDLKTVATRAGGITRDKFDPEWQPSVIGELDDLAHALGAIDRILVESAQQTRRRFLRPEREPTEREIAWSCHGLAGGTAPVGPPGAPRCLVRRIGRGECDDFWGVSRGPGGWQVLIGRLAIPAEGLPAVQRSVRAEAAREFASGLLQSRPTKEIWPEVDAVFSLTRAVLVSRPFHGGLDVVTHGDVAQPIEPLLVLASASDEKDVPGTTPFATERNGAADRTVTTAAPLAQCSVLVLGTLSPPLLAAARDYVRYARDATRAIDELPDLFAGREGGLLVVLFLS